MVQSVQPIFVVLNEARNRPTWNALLSSPAIVAIVEMSARAPDEASQLELFGRVESLLSWLAAKGTKLPDSCWQYTFSHVPGAQSAVRFAILFAFAVLLYS
jgi:hypothetical protein